MLDKKISVIVIHRSEKELKNFISIISKFSEFTILAETISGNEGVELIFNFLPQMVFIHLQPQELTGFEIVETIQNKYFFPEICFMADDDSEAFESMDHRPLDFLVEPIQKNEIQNMLFRLKLSLRKKELIKKMEFFAHENAVVEKKVLQRKGGILLVNPNEVIYCKAEQTNTALLLQSGESPMVKTGLTETIEILNNPDLMKVSRSYYINKRHLRKVERKRGKCSLFYNGKTWEVPASRIAIDQLENWNTSEIY